MEEQKEPDSNRATGKEKVWALVRVVLGLAQVMAATVTLFLLIQTGMSNLTIEAVVVTCLLTTTSVLLFRNRKGR